MATGKLSKSPSTLRLVQRDEVAAAFKEPFIISGYRQPDCSYADCLRYTLVPHNELGNFWTHFLPIGAWLFWIQRLPPAVDLSDPYFYPLLSFWLGAIVMHLFSSIMHGFSCKSSTVRDVTTMLDYLGIAVYSYGGGILSICYNWPTDYYPLVHRYRTQILCLMVISCVNVMVTSCLSLYFWPKYRYALRATSVAIAYILSTIPWLCRFRACIMTETDCTPETFYCHFIDLGATVIAAFLFTSKLPERIAPGKFDYIGHSHQLFHVAITTQTAAELYGLPQLALERRLVLEEANISPNFYSCVFPQLIVLVSGMAVMFVLGLLVSKGQLVSHRSKIHYKSKTN